MVAEVFQSTELVFWFFRNINSRCRAKSDPRQRFFVCAAHLLNHQYWLQTMDAVRLLEAVHLPPPASPRGIQESTAIIHNGDRRSGSRPILCSRLRMRSHRRNVAPLEGEIQRARSKGSAQSRHELHRPLAGVAVSIAIALATNHVLKAQIGQNGCALKLAEANRRDVSPCKRALLRFNWDSHARPMQPQADKPGPSL